VWPSRFKVKICGITSWRDAKLAIEAGADALGFNFYPPSPRYITPSRARAIIRRLPRRVRSIGVFVDEPTDKVKQVVRKVGIDLLQLHGDEPPEQVAACARLRPVIKAFHVRRGFRPAALASYCCAAAFLLDGFSSKLPGGMGRRFDWRVARRAKRYGRIILAGGLRPANIARAIREVRPAAVDICSGLEARPGRKDPARLRALREQLKGVRHLLR